MQNFVEAVPAYGRVYETESALLSDWHDGKDFRLVGGAYFSIRDVDALVHNLHIDVLMIDGVFIKLEGV